MTQKSSFHRFAVLTALCSIVALGLAAPSEAQGTAPELRASCALEGSWLSEVDIGARFFVTYGRGANATEGPMTITWIAGDPTLFGSFPSAVGLTSAAGSWRKGPGPSDYRYTWIGYGVDGMGAPLYAWKGSGTGTLQGCDMIVFDYVVEIYPWPMDPLDDDPVACLAGTGSKRRVTVDLGACP
ncbi:MAG TPA: hypothetical protein VLT32_13950 [Candidatus Sulfomarinibacteraceae bacterium]|nr:hypothetical protein [Candidatus Sulfomarinibacteraceae bacterium]